MALALAAVPVAAFLAFDPGGWFAFGPAKWAAITVVALVAVASAFGTGPHRHVDRWTTVAWGAFLGWGAVSAALGLEGLYAWTGTPDRRLGWATWLLMGLLFMAGQLTGSRRVVTRGVVVAALGVGIYASLELVGLEPVSLAVETDRAGGTFGNAAYLGAAVALAAPVCAGHAIDRAEPFVWRALGALAVAGTLVAAVAAESRAGWVGLTAAALVALWAARRWLLADRRRLAGVAATALIVVVGTLSLSDLGSRATDSRIDEWAVGLDVVAANPVVGVGPEGYRIAFPGEVDEAYERAYGRAFTPDRAHNALLDVGASFGLPGLVAYVALLAGVGRRVVRASSPWLVGIAAALVGYVAQQQFLFPLAEIDPVFWLLAGVLVGATQRPSEVVALPRTSMTAVAVITAAAAVAAGFVGTLDVVADRQAAAAVETGEVGDADAARGLRPDSIRYHVVAAGLATDPEDALARIDDALAVSPRDPILRMLRADALLARSDWDAAVTALEQLAADDPNNARVHLQLGVASLGAGDRPGAELAWLRAEELSPRDPVPASNLAALYLETGRTDEARAAAGRALAIDADDPQARAVLARLDR